MGYQTSEEETEDVDLTTADLALDKDEPDFQGDGFEEADISEWEQLAKKTKASRFSLKARRAIEDHLEQRKLRKETDYFFDDHFVEEDETDSTKEA
jgi:hypothetical protein